MPIEINGTHPMNLKILSFLETESDPGATLVSGFEPGEGPYLRQGSHPDVVQRLWDEINPALPDDARCLVKGFPALVHPTIDACVNNALFGRPRFAVISRREEGAMRAIVTDEQRRNRPKVGLPEGPGRFRSGDCVVRRSHSPRYAPSSRLVGAPKSPRPNRVLFTQASIREFCSGLQAVPIIALGCLYRALKKRKLKGQRK